MIEMRPVTLALFAWQGAKPQVSLGRRTRTMERDLVPEVVMAAPVATLIDHRIQTAGRE